MLICSEVFMFWVSDKCSSNDYLGLHLINCPFSLFAGAEFNQSHSQDDDIEEDLDFLTNVTRTQGQKVHFGHGSVKHGRDSRYWDRDDRRRDDDYSEEELERNRNVTQDKVQSPPKGKNSDEKSSSSESVKDLDHRGKGLYNEAGRDELKVYEAKYQASLDSIGQSQEGNITENHPSDIIYNGTKSEMIDIDKDNSNTEEYDEYDREDGDYSTTVGVNNIHSFGKHDAGIKNKGFKEAGKASTVSSNDNPFSKSQHFKGSTNSIHDSQDARTASEKRPASRKRSKRRKLANFCCFFSLFVLCGLDNILFQLLIYIRYCLLEIIELC